MAEAREVLRDLYPAPSEKTITLSYPAGDNSWTYTLEELGITLDDQTILETAMAVGRQGGPINRLIEQYQSWYYGHQVAPILIFDEGKVDLAINDIAAEINRPAADATLIFDGSEVDFATSQVGHQLEMANTRERLLAAMERLQDGELQLLVHDTQPRVNDTSEAAREIQNIISSPMSFYFEEPLSGVDLERVTLPVDQLVRWIRVHTVENEGGPTTEVMIDENAVRAWLNPYAEQLQREPENARYYFDDNSRELVLVESHVSGRELDIEATVQLFTEQVKTTNRSIPFAIKEVVPTVHAQATAADLGITELVSESTTWFYGSAVERMHNIARSASNFYGIVIAPGQEFSFNEFLGEVSSEQGYETGLIIYGGRTIEGVGGGVCQVSTTAFQAAFWAGFPIVERWEHGYQVGYYDDGEGPGMDATVYSPLVDLRFINDTPHHLLIENYYNEANSSLTFKFYSTSLGRTVLKEGPFVDNVVPAKEDLWELNEDLATDEIEQVDWAVEGADVAVDRQVFNTLGELIRQDTFVSHYIPWQNIYQFGPGTELPLPEPTDESTSDS